MWRVFTSAILFYLTLDFADPNMPGAVNFGADQSVEAVDAEKVRPSLMVPGATVLPPIPLVLLADELAPSDLSTNPSVPRRSPPATRARALVSDPIPAAPDDH